jgi:hypothetical protein
MAANRGTMIYVPREFLDVTREVMINEDRSRPDALRVIAKRAKLYRKSAIII